VSYGERLLPKSRKRLKRLSDLPRWFDLSKYEACESFDITDWQIELERRWWLFLPSSKNEMPPLEDDIFVHFYITDGCFSDNRYIFAELFANPIGGEVTSSWISQSEQMKGNLFVKSLDVGAIHWLHNHVSDSLGTKIDDELSPVERSYFDLIDRSDKRFNLSVDDVISNVVTDFGNRKTICLDMTAPDEVLIAEFKAWLLNSREKFKIPAPTRSFTAKDFKKWSDHQVLPYLDLRLWALVQGVTITNKLMGEAIFPDEFDLDTTEKIRQTIAPLAKRLISPEIVFSLHAQQESENRE
jgi:hypothetical protein